MPSRSQDLLDLWRPSCLPWLSSHLFTLGQSTYSVCQCTATHLPPPDFGPTLSVQNRDSCNQNLRRIHRSEAPRALGGGEGAYKGSLLLPEVCAMLWRIPNQCHQSVPAAPCQLSPVLLVPLGPFSVIGVQAGICSLAVLLSGIASRLHTMSAPGPLRGPNLWVSKGAEGHPSSQFTQPI